MIEEKMIKALEVHGQLRSTLQFESVRMELWMISILLDR